MNYETHENASLIKSTFSFSIGIRGSFDNLWSLKIMMLEELDKINVTRTGNLIITPSPFRSKDWSHPIKKLQRKKSSLFNIIAFPSLDLLPLSPNRYLLKQSWWNINDTGALDLLFNFDVRLSSKLSIFSCSMRLYSFTFKNSRRVPKIKIGWISKWHIEVTYKRPVITFQKIQTTRTANISTSLERALCWNSSVLICNGWILLVGLYLLHRLTTFQKLTVESTTPWSWKS